MLTSFLRPSAVPSLSNPASFVWAALAGAIGLSALYLSDALTPALAMLYASIVGAPVALTVALIPTVLMVALVAFAARRGAGWTWRWAIIAGLTPLAAQTLVMAPLSHSMVAGSALDDGGTLPVFQDTDVVAIMDLKGRQSRHAGLCGPACVSLLQSTSVPAVFLPRTYFDEFGDASGVIYRLAPRTALCDQTVQMARQTDVCLSVEPARLAQSTHILSKTELPATSQSPNVGLHQAAQIQLRSMQQTKPIYQETGFAGRVYSRWPLLGDPAWGAATPKTHARFLTRPIERPLADVRLMDWFVLELRRQHPIEDHQTTSSRWTRTWP